MDFAVETVAYRVEYREDPNARAKGMSAFTNNPYLNGMYPTDGMAENETKRFEIGNLRSQVGPADVNIDKTRLYRCLEFVANSAEELGLFITARAEKAAIAGDSYTPSNLQGLSFSYKKSRQVAVRWDERMKITHQPQANNFVQLESMRPASRLQQ